MWYILSLRRRKLLINRTTLLKRHYNLRSWSIKIVRWYQKTIDLLLIIYNRMIILKINYLLSIQKHSRGITISPSSKVILKLCVSCKNQIQKKKYCTQQEMKALCMHSYSNLTKSLICGSSTVLSVKYFWWSLSLLTSILWIKNFIYNSRNYYYCFKIIFMNWMF